MVLSLDKTSLLYLVLSLNDHSHCLLDYRLVDFYHASGILLFYVSIALGQLFQNRRGFKAILFFFLLCIVLSIIGTAFNPLKDSYAVGSALVYGNIDDFGPNFIPGLIYEVIKIVSMYFTIHYISKYKLNLQ